MSNLSTIIQMVSLPTALIAIIISISSFYYGRKPLIHITSNKIGPDYNMLTLDDNEFIIKNVSQNPAKDIQTKVKLIYNENAHDIGEYELNYLNPESHDVFRDISKRIESKLKNLKLVVKTEEKRSIKTNDGEDLLIINSLKIDSDFKINIEFKITCKADILVPTWINTHKFQYNFEISYAKNVVDSYGHYVGVPYGHEDNYIIIIKPSNGNWK
jgi:hypothetical protein